jgi:hypothetical protein
MAHFAEKHLNCKLTEKFLKSRGFILQKDCVHSKWVTPNFMLFLTSDDVIHNDEQLYGRINQQGYYDGKADGKEEAFESILNGLRSMVYPRTTQSSIPRC